MATRIQHPGQRFSKDGSLIISTGLTGVGRGGGVLNMQIPGTISELLNGPGGKGPGNSQVSNLMGTSGGHESWRNAFPLWEPTNPQGAAA